MDIPPQIARLIEEIRDDRRHGASQLARQALTVLRTSAGLSHSTTVEAFLQAQAEVARRLESIRPVMAPLRSIVGRYLDALSATAGEHDLDPVRRLAVTTADRLIEESLQAVQRIARSAADLVSDGDRLVTHSYSSTVVAALREVFTRHRDVTVVVSRSGPGRSGERTALELAGHASAITFMDDSAIGLYVPGAGKVFVGADRITADGKLINGIGTCPLAVVARHAGVPLYVLCETLKFDPATVSVEVDLEEKDAGQVEAPGALPPGVTARNPGFDITLLELVAGVVTENGVLKPEEVARSMLRLTAGI